MTDVKRRIFLKGSLAAGTVGVAVGAGLLTPQTLLAAWNEAAFRSKEVPAAVKAYLGSDTLEESAAIQVKAPDIAENGAVVPITVETDMPNVSSIVIIASGNEQPLIAGFQLGAGAVGFVSTRIKMAKTADVVAVVKAGDKLYSAKKEVKVTIGGCGG